MIIDPELKRWRKVRNDFDKQFKSIHEMAEYLMILDKKDKRVVFGSPATSSIQPSSKRIKKSVRKRTQNNVRESTAHKTSRAHSHR